MKKILAAILISGLMVTTALSNWRRLGNRASYAAQDNADVETGETGFTVTKIGDGVYAALGGDEDPAESNAGFIVGHNGVVVVDTFEDVGAARDLLAAIRKVTNLPIRYVINTHYHFDHVGGNAVFAEAGATILAQRNLRGWVRTENYKFFGADPKPEKRAFVEAFVLPDMTYADAVDIYLGNRLIQVRYMLGHTGGDSVVILPSAKNYTTDIVFGGDLIWQKRVPNLIDASTELWTQTLDKLLTNHAKAIFVPGHGDIAAADDVRAFRDYFVALRKHVAKFQNDGKSGTELADAVMAELKATYGTWTFFDPFVKRNIALTAAELKGEKKLPPPAKN
ncbi:MAG: MBL fold metallo-hydrolase [Pyrinomonadaceae bacterium]|nr:MBL fold metallo-hydrolase [Pyrinomonadaceae bacterium]